MISAALSLLTWGKLGSLFTGFFKGLWKAITGFLGSLNSQGWLGLIVTSALLVVLVREWSEARHWTKQDARDVKALHVLQASDAKQAADALKLKAQIDAQSRVISEKNKELNDAQNARIDADANAARVRGPGKAVCPGLPAAPSGSQQAPSTTTDAGPQVPSGDWARVSWSWLVSVIEEHDQLLNEDQTWRNNDKQQRQNWPKPTKP